MKSFVQVVAMVFLALVAVKLLVVFWEPKLTFYPYKEISHTPADLGIDYKEVWIRTEDGENLCAWWMERADPIAEILFFHGNGGNISLGRLDLLSALHRNGYSVFVFDYRGYGKSSGTPSEKGLLADCRAIVPYFWNSLHRAENRVVYLGRSLGGFTASYASSLRAPDGLILEGTFPDKKTLLKKDPVLWLLGQFSRYELDTMRFLETVDCPVLQIHGARDRVIPLWVGQELHQRLQTKKEFYLLAEAGHADQYLVDGKRYWRKLQDFVEAL